MHLEVIAHLGVNGSIYPADPRIEAVSPIPSATAQMGDIVCLNGNQLDLSVMVEAHSPIERVDILNGAQTVEALRPYQADPEGRLRIIWQGAEYRGRGRTTHWRGKIRFDQARIENMKRINFWNLDRPFHLEDDRTIVFDAVTTGNFGGCDIWLDTSDCLLYTSPSPRDA